MENLAHPAATSNVAWLAYWARRGLPVLQSSREQLLLALRRADRVSPSDLADIVLKDPLLTAQALRYINQRQKSSLAADITTINGIVMLMGVAPFIEHFTRLPVLEDVLQGHPRTIARIHKCIADTRFTAKMAREFAGERYDAHLDEIFISALLSRMPEMLELLAHDSDPSAPHGKDHAHALLAAWSLPQSLSALLSQETENMLPRQSLQYATLQLAHLLDRGWWQPGVAEALNAMAEILNTSVDDVWQRTNRLMLQYARNEPQKQGWPAARWLPMLPGEWPQPVAAPSPVPATQVAPAPAPVLITKDILAERMQALHLAGTQGAPANQIMTLAVRALAEGLGMRRILFALLVAGENAVKARFAHGIEPSDPARQLHIKLDEPHLLTRLMLKQQSIWLNSGNAESLEPMLPAGFRDQVGKEEFCAMSIFVGDKAVGIIYADRQGGDHLADTHYQHFKQIGLLTSRALSHHPAQHR
ncbi:HDOD domain-containing protein [Iodobacter fluviatilis]|uniref:HDOD domain n=1 Tax=Iodobacter fluviatilis TaxID=537 RepID=A0A377Q964_9NEIS|nr:HDOD domain-containing protein [Iodobacter fluviatilis]TCU88681.1 HDOD domain-containing protein [Iodobacter fluviatilis]STQ91248.1 HDOD domain [Iodobacter fluviatilis]